MKPIREHPRMRSGFSLPELLVAVAIIAVLAALTVGIVSAVISNRERGNTEAAMRVVHKALQQHWAHVVADARKEKPSAPVLSLAGGDPRRAEVIWIKMRLVEAFPQRYAEVLPAPDWHAYIPPNRRKYATGYQRALATANPASPPEVQSAACLLMALSVRRGGSALTEDDLQTAVRDTDGDGLKEFVDGWGQPIAFTRFGFEKPPAFPGLQSQNPAKMGKGAKFCDPLDPDGLLLNPTWISTFGAQFESTCGYELVSTVTPGTANYVVPVLTSKGGRVEEGDTDLPEPIYSYSLRLD